MADPKSGTSLVASGNLFPELQQGSFHNSSGPTGQFNPEVISSILLADSKNSYSFLYNAYGELAQVTLPTGGYYRYQYQQPSANGCFAGGDGAMRITWTPNGQPNYAIYRRLTERDEYANGGSTRTAVTKYTGCTGPGDPSRPGWPTTQTEVDYYAGDGTTMLRKEMHYFYGDPSSPNSIPAPNAYPNWSDGLEYRTQIYDGGGALLQDSSAIWTQRPCAAVSIYTNSAEVCASPYTGAGTGSSTTPNYTSAAGPAHDPVVCQTTTSIDSSGAAGTILSYDQYNNPIHQYEYGFGNAPAVASVGSASTNPCGNATGTWFRQTDLSYNYGTSFWQASQPGLNLWNLPSSITVTDVAHSTPSNSVASTRKLNYDEGTLASYSPASGYTAPVSNANRGNLTSDIHVLTVSGANTNLSHSYQYDVVGNVVQESDENPTPNITTYNYSDPNGTYANLTGVTLGGNQSSPLPHLLSVSMAYDYNTGNLTSVTDANNVTSTYSYADSTGAYDPFDRVRSVTHAGGLSTTTVQYPTLNQTYQFDDQLTNGDGLLRVDYYSDGLGRPVSEYDYENTAAGSQTYILNCRAYDALSRVAYAANPVRGYGDCPTAVGAGAPYTQTSYDGLGRPLTVTRPDSSQASAVYSGTTSSDVVTVKDEAQRKKQISVDSAGRVSSVVEDPAGVSYQTTYDYNHLDELLTVKQASQTRTFTYDTLGRLLTSAQPEYSGSGTITYGYYNNGTLQSRQSPNTVTSGGQTVPVLTSYTYDALNRITGISYNDGLTPTVTYSYDGARTQNLNGRLNSVTVGSGSSLLVNSYAAYDAAGHVLSSSQTAGSSAPYPFTYTYAASGALLTETYPSGRTISQQYDGNNRISQLSALSSPTVPGKNYLSSINYCAHGGVQSLQVGAVLNRGFSYNSRLQPTEIMEGGGATSDAACANATMPTGANALLDMQFSWTGTAGNNGLLQGHKVITGPQSGATSALSVSQTFSYDNVNRITSFSDNGSGSALSRNFSYTGNSDGGQLGNVYVSGNDAGLPLLSTVSVTSSANIDATTNRLKTAGSQAYAYDANGNLTSIGPAGSATYTFTYDAENRQITRHDAGGVTTQFTYDGLGQRVQIAAGGASPTTYVYDAFGRMVADYGSPVASPPCTTCYLSVDHLGSTRMVTDQYGNAVARHDYAPFGDELVSGAGRGNLWGASDSVRQKFTGVEQDNGDINFNQARYYLLPQGRFNSPDPVNFGADILNPQSWNGYSYVLNSPLSGVDPDGLQSISGAGGAAGTASGPITISLDSGDVGFSIPTGNGPSGTKTPAYAYSPGSVYPSAGGSTDSYAAYPLTSSSPLGAALPVFLRSRPYGHHLISQWSKIPAGSDLGELARLLRTGELGNKVWHVGFSKEHILYNNVVNDIMRLAENEFGVPRTSFTLEQSQRVAGRILNNPTLRPLLDQLQRANPANNFMQRFLTAIGDLGSDELGLAFSFLIDPSVFLQTCRQGVCGQSGVWQ